MGELPEDLGATAIKHFLDVFITPEVERRQAAGVLPRPVELRAAQIICHGDGRPNGIRLNQEVRAVAGMRLKHGVSKVRGEAVFEHELDGLYDIRLPDAEDPNCGHATILRLGRGWTLAFDFVYNKAIIRDHLAAAEQFLSASRHALADGHMAAFVENLFAAAELAAASWLLRLPNNPVRPRRGSHGTIRALYNRHTHLGNVPKEHARTLNRLDALRPAARYRKAPLALESTETAQLLQIVTEMVAEAYARIDTGHDSGVGDSGDEEAVGATQGTPPRNRHPP